MTHMSTSSVTLALTLIPAALGAQSLPVPDRGYLNVSGDFRMAAATFTNVVHPIEFIEPATVDTIYRAHAAPGFDVGGGVRVWRNLAVGVALSRFTKKDTGAVSAQLPHPFLLDRPRAVSGDATGLSRSETATHIVAMWTLPLNARSRLSAFGGPSLLAVRQDLVSDVTFSQTYPYDSAAYTGVVTERRSASRLGFNVGADVTYLMAAHVGVGLSTTFSRARVRLPSASDETIVNAGGVHVGAGVRFRF